MLIKGMRGTTFFIQSYDIITHPIQNKSWFQKTNDEQMINGI